MAHIPPPGLPREIAAIGIDTLSEGITDPLGHGLADAAGGIAETERVKRFLSGLLGSLTPAQLSALQTAVRWGGRLTSSTLKAAARRVMVKHHVEGNLMYVVIDAIDDLCEILARRTEAALAPTQVQAYVGQAVDHAVANPSPSTTRAAAAAHGVSMTPTFKLPSETLTPLIAAEIATLSANGIKRFGRLWLIKHESFYGDPKHELHGSATLEEAIRALLVVQPQAVRVLNRTDLKEDETDIRQDEAIRAFLGMAEIYLVSASLAARAHDEADRLMGGGVRRMIKENAVAAGGIIKTGGIRVIKAMAWSAVAGLVAVVLGIGIVSWGVFATKPNISLAHVSVGTIVSLMGMGFFGVSMVIWETGKAGVLWAYGTAGAPIGYFKAVVKAVAHTFGINIEQESA